MPNFTLRFLSWFWTGANLCYFYFSCEELWFFSIKACTKMTMVVVKHRCCYLHNWDFPCDSKSLQSAPSLCPSSKIPLSVDKGANFSSLAISTASSPSPSNSAQAVQRSWFGILTCLLREGYWLLIQVFPEVRFKIILIKSRDIKTSNGWRGLHQHLLPVKHPQGRAAVSLKKRLDWRAHLCEERLIIHSGRWIAARTSLLKWYLLNSQYWQRP